jgi:hypothetical protein
VLLKTKVTGKQVEANVSVDASIIQMLKEVDFKKKTKMKENINWLDLEKQI